MPDNFVHSAELRWFLPGQERWNELLYWFRWRDRFPLKIEGAYARTESPEAFVKQEKPRTDDYLCLPICDTCGIKQREGRLEVKTLVAGPIPFNSGTAIGRTEQWAKWLFVPSAALTDQLKMELEQSGSWCSVAKQRNAQKISLEARRPVAVSPDVFPATGCNIELTAINVMARNDVWVTFGFEAFGASGRVMALLDEVVQYFFAMHGPAPVRLDGRDSLSYPAWLSVLR